MKNSLFLLFIFLTTLVIAGCAAIIHGSHQDIAVNSVPNGAKVIVMGVHKATTPAVVTVKRSNPNIILKFEKEGYEPVEIALTRSVDAWIVGNIIFGGVIGLIVDFASGSAYKINPNSITANLPAIQSINESTINPKAILLVEIQDVD